MFNSHKLIGSHKIHTHKVHTATASQPASKAAIQKYTTRCAHACIYAPQRVSDIASLILFYLPIKHTDDIAVGACLYRRGAAVEMSINRLGPAYIADEETFSDGRVFTPLANRRIFFIAFQRVCSIKRAL